MAKPYNAGGHSAMQIIELLRHLTLRLRAHVSVPFSSYVLSPVATSAIFPKLDCFQAFGIKRYTLGATGGAGRNVTTNRPEIRRIRQTCRRRSMKGCSLAARSRRDSGALPCSAFEALEWP